MHAEFGKRLHVVQGIGYVWQRRLKKITLGTVPAAATAVCRLEPAVRPARYTTTPSSMSVSATMLRMYAMPVFFAGRSAT